MIDAPEAPHHHHPAHTGRHWLDISLALSAMFVSVISLVVAVEHGRTMERLVAANSWPFLSYGAGTTTTNGIPSIHMHLSNTGVGPAKIESAELIWKGVAYGRDQDFLKACCGFDPAAGMPFDSDLLPHEVLRAGEQIKFLGFTQSASAAVFAALQRAMVSRDLHLNICYCSIFDDCWKADLTLLSLKPDPVQACVQPKLPFDQGILSGNP
jgi:hypothetical protein